MTYDILGRIIIIISVRLVSWHIIWSGMVIQCTQLCHLSTVTFEKETIGTASYNRVGFLFNLCSCVWLDFFMYFPASSFQHILFQQSICICRHAIIYRYYIILSLYHLFLFEDGLADLEAKNCILCLLVYNKARNIINKQLG